MRILTRYLLKAHLGPFLFALGMLTGILFVQAVARRFEELAGKGLETRVILEVFALSLPHIIALTLPMAVLVAVLYAFSQLAADNEITAIKGTGVNLARLVVPLALAGTALAAGMVWFNDAVLPETNHRLASLLVDIARKSPTLELREQMINEIQTGDMRSKYFLQAAKIDPATNRLRDVVIYDLSTPTLDRTIYADSGQMAFNRERTDLFLTLHDGFINEVGSQEPETMQRLFFVRQQLRLAGVGNELERTLSRGYRSDREMSLAMLADEVETARRERETVQARAEAELSEAVRRALAGPAGRSVSRAEGGGYDVPMRGPAPVAFPSGPELAIRGSAVDALDDQTRRTGIEVRTLEGQARMLTLRMNSYQVEYHKKYAIPFACIVFVLIGAPLAVRFPRGGVGMVIAVSLAIFTIYYMTLIGGEELADNGYVPAFWAMWAPNLVFFGVGLWGLTRIGKETATTRGGGWDDLLGSLRDAAARPAAALFRRRAR
jgi:lipopolysaccharide export system permease protein